MREEDLPARVGHRFPGGRCRIEPYVDWLVRDMLQAGGPEDCLHPTVAFLAAQDGLGIGLEDLFALFGASSADGPMLGEWSVEFARPLRAGVEYTVRGEVSDVRRRRGRSGVLDLADVRIELTGPDGSVHATVCPTYAFPRRATA